MLFGGHGSAQFELFDDIHLQFVGVVNPNPQAVRKNFGLKKSPQEKGSGQVIGHASPQDLFFQSDNQGFENGIRNIQDDWF